MVFPKDGEQTFVSFPRDRMSQPEVLDLSPTSQHQITNPPRHTTYISPPNTPSARSEIQSPRPGNNTVSGPVIIDKTTKKRYIKPQLNRDKKMSILGQIDDIINQFHKPVVNPIAPLEMTLCQLLITEKGNGFTDYTITLGSEKVKLMWERIERKSHPNSYESKSLTIDIWKLIKAHVSSKKYQYRIENTCSQGIYATYMLTLTLLNTPENIITIYSAELDTHLISRTKALLKNTPYNRKNVKRFKIASSINRSGLTWIPNFPANHYGPIYDYGPDEYGKSKDAWAKDIIARLNGMTVCGENGSEQSVKIKLYSPKFGVINKIYVCNPWYGEK